MQFKPSPRIFFEAGLQDALAKRRAVYRSVNALVSFVVWDHGAWTLDLRRDGDGRVHRGIAAQPNALVQMRGDFFPMFASGRFVLREAIEAGQLRIDGDGTALVRVANLLRKIRTIQGAGALRAPSQAGFSVRSGSTSTPRNTLRNRI
ncbi:MAG: SCP2 sterol-binding domain-containing protein [Myxococcota bacterium]